MRLSIVLHHFFAAKQTFYSRFERDREADQDHRDVVEHHDDVVEHAFEVDVRAVVGVEERGVGDHKEREREQHRYVEVAAESDEAVERAEEGHRDQSPVDDHDDAVPVESDDVHAVEQQHSQRDDQQEGKQPEVKFADVGDHCRREQHLRRAEEEDAAQHKADREFFFKQFFEHQHDVAGGAEHQARQHDRRVAQVVGVGECGEDAYQHKADRRRELENARPNAFFVDVERARGDRAHEDVGAERIDPPSHRFPPVGSECKVAVSEHGDDGAVLFDPVDVQIARADHEVDVFVRGVCAAGGELLLGHAVGALDQRIRLPDREVTGGVLVKESVEEKSVQRAYRRVVLDESDLAQVVRAFVRLDDVAQDLFAALGAEVDNASLFEFEPKLVDDVAVVNERHGRIDYAVDAVAVGEREHLFGRHVRAKVLAAERRLARAGEVVAFRHADGEVGAERVGVVQSGEFLFGKPSRARGQI